MISYILMLLEFIISKAIYMKFKLNNSLEILSFINN